MLYRTFIACLLVIITWGLASATSITLTGAGVGTPLPSNSFNAVSNWSATKLFNRTPGSNTNQLTATWSGWVKRSTAGVTGGGTIWTGDSTGSGAVAWLIWNAADQVAVYTNGGGTGVMTTNTFASTSTWYFIVLRIDASVGSPATAIEVNGVNQAMTVVSEYVSGVNINFNITTKAPRIGYDGGTNGPCKCKIGFPQWIDGQTLATSNFTQAGTGGTVPKKFSGTFGGNGWALDFSNTGSLGTDSSGNGNNMSVNSIVAGDASAENLFY